MSFVRVEAGQALTRLRIPRNRLVVVDDNPSSITPAAHEGGAYPHGDFLAGMQCPCHVVQEGAVAEVAVDVDVKVSNFVSGSSSVPVEPGLGLRHDLVGTSQSQRGQHVELEDVSGLLGGKRVGVST